jgi:hypothetical protein
MKDCAHVPELGGQQLPTAAKTRPTIEELREYFDYDPGTGILRWKKRPARNVFAGSVAASRPNSLGYLRVKLGRVQLAQHRVAFAMHHGRWPTPCCDHIDGNRLNNRADNLRECDASENQHNRRNGRNNTTGYKGVRRRGDSYSAQVMINSVAHYKSFRRLEDAAAWVKQTREQLHGEFARH